MTQPERLVSEDSSFIENSGASLYSWSLESVGRGGKKNDKIGSAAQGSGGFQSTG